MNGLIVPAVRCCFLSFWTGIDKGSYNLLLLDTQIKPFLYSHIKNGLFVKDRFLCRLEDV